VGLGGLDGGENHEGKRREEKKENILSDSLGNT
jgi:hypothetical protein